jgi:membrane protease YdiL (CAAX protease family)
LSGDNLYIILLVNQFVIVFIPVLIYTLKNKLNIKRVFRLNKLRFTPAVLILLISVPAYFAAAMLNNIMVYFLQYYIQVPEAPVPVPGNGIELLISLIVLAVSPAICEELLHRGLILNAFERRGTIRAIFLSAMIFGLFHFEITNLIGPVFLGSLIAYYVVRTNSIFAGMLAHFINNSFYVLTQYFYSRNMPPRGSIYITPAALGSIAVIGISGLILVWILLKVFRKATDNTYVKFPAISSVKGDIAAVFTHWPVVIVSTVYVLLAGIYFFALFVNNMGPVK